MGLARFLKVVAAQEDRWPLWLPVALGAGAALYFALPMEPPPLWADGALVLAACLTLLSFGQRRAGLRMLLALAAMTLLGWGLAKLRQEQVAAPVLDRTLTAHMTGRVAAVEIRDRGERVLLTDLVSGVFGGTPPAKVRISFMRRDPLLAPGAWIGVTARLMPPPAPAMPGAADYGRADYFAGVGAVGFAYGGAYPGMAARPLTVSERVAEGIERLRWRMTGRIQQVLQGSTGAIAAALITGSRGGIADADEEALRDAGLAHVLAIAGLHMALVGGGLFWLVRALLAAVPALALRYPIKKWAAVAALAMSSFYLVISGAAPSAVRAFVMLAAALVAVLADRPVLSMRSLALAAAILLVLRPETVTEPGFQMSFAAVAALVAVAEWEARRPRVRRGALWRHLRAIALTSLIASLATLPYAVFHFGRATHYAVLGNLLAMPVMGLWVMPSAALSVAAMPLGWEAGPLHLLDWGIGVMLALGRFVSGLPGAVSALPAMPMATLVLVSLGGLWCALWRGGMRWFGVAGIAAGVAVMLWSRPPDMLIAPDGMTVALRGANGLQFVGMPADKYVARAWLERAGQEDTDFAPAPARCDGLGCVARVDGRLLAVGRRPEAEEEDCARAAIVISAADHVLCPAALLAAGRQALAHDQGYAITGSRVQSVRAWRGMRPWVQ